MIEVKNLEFTYRGNRDKTLKGLNFTIRPGEIFGFLGPSGAGKSTTQNILIGILKGYQGSVKVLGKELNGITPDYYEKIGVSFELPNLYTKFTGLENLEFFKSMYAGTTEAPRALLAMVGLEEHQHTRVEKWSKGMKMRLNFCRALLNKPEVLFFDEPTTGLDPTNARNIKDIILSYKNAGKTIFITTHNMEVAESICDRLAFIVDGELALTDSPGELMVRMGEKKVRVGYFEGGKNQSADFDLEGIADNAMFLALLREKKVRTIHTQEASLEDIFIQVTGRKLV